MKTTFFAAATLGFLVIAGGANAGLLPVGVTSLTPHSGDAIPAGEVLITDFNSTGGTGPSSQGGTISDLAAGFHFTQVNPALSYTRDGFAGLDPSVSAPPPLDNPDPTKNPTELTNPVQPGAFYETVLTNGYATLTSDKGLTQFSFYMGSPDTYNHITFTFVGVSGDTAVLDGTDIWGGNPPGDGDQSFGTTVVYTFGPEAVKSITFHSTGNSFEVDKFAGIAVPEPATWAMMIMGFGMAGGLVRAKRRGAVAA